MKAEGLQHQGFDNLLPKAVCYAAVVIASIFLVYGLVYGSGFSYTVCTRLWTVSGHHAALRRKLGVHRGGDSGFGSASGEEQDGVPDHMPSVGVPEPLLKIGFVSKGFGCG